MQKSAGKDSANVSREMETLSKYQKEILKIKYTAKEVKNGFDRLISSLDTAKERISEHEDMSAETS